MKDVLPKGLKPVGKITGKGDISGLKIGHITFTKPVGRKNKALLWEIICDCGKIFFKLPGLVFRCTHKSCGCKKHKTIEEALNIKNNVIVTEGGCWEWCESKNPQGYGILRYKGESKLAHKISYEFHNKKKIGSKMFICHSCDNPCCINPNHLWEGKSKDNVNDCVNKKRNAHGEKHGNASLTNKQVLEIKRTIRKEKVHLIKQLATKYGVSYGTVNHIDREDNWKFL